MIYFLKQVTSFSTAEESKRLTRGLITTYELFFKVRGKYTTLSENKG